MPAKATEESSQNWGTQYWNQPALAPRLQQQRAGPKAEEPEPEPALQYTMHQLNPRYHNIPQSTDSTKEDYFVQYYSNNELNVLKWVFER